MMEENEKINYKDIILVLGCCLSPMTGLRVWKVGPGEILCLLYCVINLSKLRIISLKNCIIRFWLFFLPVLLVGTLWGVKNYPSESYLADYVIWMYFGIISVLIFTIVKTKSFEVLSRLLSSIAIFTGIWYLLLYVYSIFVSKSFLGAPLWYYYRFSGGATNPHQIAILLCLAIITDLWMIISSKKIATKLFYIILFIITTLLLQATQSSTAIMALVVGVAVVVWQNIWLKTKNKKSLFIVALALFLLVCLLSYLKLYAYFLRWIQSDANGQDRFEIFKSFPTALAKGPVFGIGPGNHARNGTMEFHNTYLEIFAMSGLCGFLVFFIFSIKLIVKSARNPISFATITALYVYGLAGFGARRLVFWLVVVLAYNLASKSQKDMNMTERRIEIAENKYS